MFKMLCFGYSKGTTGNGYTFHVVLYIKPIQIASQNFGSLKSRKSYKKHAAKFLYKMSIILYTHLQLSKVIGNGCMAAHINVDTPNYTCTQQSQTYFIHQFHV